MRRMALRSSAGAARARCARTQPRHRCCLQGRHDLVDSQPRAAHRRANLPPRPRPAQPVQLLGGGGQIASGTGALRPAPPRPGSSPATSPTGRTRSLATPANRRPRTASRAAIVPALGLRLLDHGRRDPASPHRRWRARSRENATAAPPVSARRRPRATPAAPSAPSPARPAPDPLADSSVSALSSAANGRAVESAPPRLPTASTKATPLASWPRAVSA